MPHCQRGRALGTPEPGRGSLRGPAAPAPCPTAAEPNRGRAVPSPSQGGTEHAAQVALGTEGCGSVSVRCKAEDAAQCT